MPPFPASSLPENVQQKVGIDRMTSDAAILKNGERVEADSLILCTGYRFAFPFLSDECRPAIQHDGQTVDGLYLHLIHSSFPTMSFIGIPQKVCEVTKYRDIFENVGNDIGLYDIFDIGYFRYF